MSSSSYGCLETIPEEGVIPRGRARHCLRRSTDNNRIMFAPENLHHPPVIDLALYGHDLEGDDSDSKVHRLDEQRTFDPHDNKAKYEGETYNEDPFLSDGNDDCEFSTSMVDHAGKGPLQDDASSVEIIVVPSEDSSDELLTPTAASSPPSWHELLMEQNWLALKDELNYVRAHRQTPIKDHHLLSVDSSCSALHLAAATAPSDVTLQMLELLSQTPVPEGEQDMSSMDRTRIFCLCADADGNTPLHLACARLSPPDDDDSGCIDFSVVKNLVVVAHEALRLVNDAGDTPIHVLLTSPAYAHQWNGDAEATEEAIHVLLKAAPDALMLQNKQGKTPLHVALSQQCQNCVLYRIISHGLAAFDIPDENGMKPIHYAAMYGAPLPCFELMVESAPESICHGTLNEGDSPLHCLVANIHRLARYYGERAAVGCEKSKSEKAATVAFDSVAQAVRLLLGNECHATSPLWMKNDEGYTPLHCCAMLNFPSKLIKVALDSVSPYAASVALTTLTNLGASPLHTALHELSKRRPKRKQLTTEQRINLKCIISLFTSQMTCKVVDDKGRTPLILAVQNRHPSISALFCLLKCSPQSAAVPDDEGCLALHYACRHKHVEDKVIEGMLDFFKQQFISDVYFCANSQRCSEYTQKG